MARKASPRPLRARRHSEAYWRVLWSDYRGHHDWIGRQPVKRGGNYTSGRTRPPPVLHNDFITREGAEDFVAKLRRDVPEDELLVQIVSLEKPPPAPLDQLLPGEWPRQGPRLTGPEWPSKS